jgi:hypothetical protein
MVTENSARTRGLLLALLLIAGCRQIVGFDAADADGGSASADMLPLLPFAATPEFRAGCEGCAAESCSAEHDACLADAGCRALLGCRGVCRDPVCLARCGSFDQLDYSIGLIFPQARGGESFRYYQYLACMSQSKCAGECGWGANWACLGQQTYRWPHFPDTQNTEPIHVQLELVDARFGQGVDARVTAFAPSASGMQQVSQSARSSGWGQVEFDLGLVFDGVLQIESGADALDPVRVLANPGPLFRNTRLALNPIASDVVGAVGSAAMLMIVTDCLGAFASGIAFELQGTTGDLFGFVGLPAQFTPGANTDANGIASFFNVKPTADAVTVIGKRKGEVVVKRKIYVRDGWVNQLYLHPLTEAD